MVFLELRWEPGVYSQVTTGMALQNTCLFSMSGLLSSCEGHLGILLEAWQGNRDDSRGEARDPEYLSSFQRYIGIPINFQEDSGIAPFEALNSALFSSC